MNRFRNTYQDENSFANCVRSLVLFLLGDMLQCFLFLSILHVISSTSKVVLNGRSTSVHTGPWFEIPNHFILKYFQLMGAIAATESIFSISNQIFDKFITEFI